MTELEKGITPTGEGYQGKSWNILGQRYFPKASCDSTFAFETNSDPGQHVPVHVHPTQDEFIGRTGTSPVLGFTGGQVGGAF